MKQARKGQLRPYKEVLTELRDSLLKERQRAAAEIEAGEFGWALHQHRNGIRPTVQMCLFRKAPGKTVFLVGQDRKSPRGTVIEHGDEETPTIAVFDEAQLFDYCTRILEEGGGE